MNPFFSEDYLAHYGRSKRDGAPHGSGRYPLGSGENPRAAAIAKNYKTATNAINTGSSLNSSYKRKAANKKRDRAVDEVRQSFSSEGKQRIKDAFDDYVNADKYSEDYEKHEYEYKVKALDILREKYPQTIDDKTYEQILLDAQNNPNTSWLMVEDWDQGTDSSINLYLKDKGLSGSQVEEEYINSRQKLCNAVENEVKTVLGTHGDVPIKDISESALRKRGYDQKTIDTIMDVWKNKTISKDLAEEIADKDYVYKSNAWVYTWMI